MHLFLMFQRSLHGRGSSPQESPNDLQAPALQVAPLIPEIHVTFILGMVVIPLVPSVPDTVTVNEDRAHILNPPARRKFRLSPVTEQSECKSTCSYGDTQ